jgi:hypothetical protein
MKVNSIADWSAGQRQPVSETDASILISPSRNLARASDTIGGGIAAVTVPRWDVKSTKRPEELLYFIRNGESVATEMRTTRSVIALSVKS